MPKNTIPGISRFRIDKLKKHKIKLCGPCRERKRKNSKGHFLRSCLSANCINSTPTLRLSKLRDTEKDVKLSEDADTRISGNNLDFQLLSSRLETNIIQNSESRIYTFRINMKILKQKLV